jgi:hypothetical protein
MGRRPRLAIFGQLTELPRVAWASSRQPATDSVLSLDADGGKRLHGANPGHERGRADLPCR